jgi:hypothetical protein
VVLMTLTHPIALLFAMLAAPMLAVVSRLVGI